MSEHVFLTGATGLLGSALARALLARGKVVHAMARASSDRSALQGLPLRWHEAELVEAESVLRAVGAARSDAGSAPLDLVHCAALVSYRTRDARLARAVNVEGTRHALAAAHRHGLRRVLHVSSIVTLGPSSDGRPLDEDSRGEGDALRVDYVTTKREAERLVLEAGARLDVVVVNPVAIFGSVGGRSNSGELLRRVAAGRIPIAPPGGIGAVGVEDAAAGCALALERGRRGARHVLCESNHSHLELLRLAARVAGLPGPFGRVPRPVWSALERVARGVDRVRPLERLTPQSMRMLAERFPGDATRAREELGWRPRPIEDVLRAALGREPGTGAQGRGSLP